MNGLKDNIQMFGIVHVQASSVPFTDSYTHTLSLFVRQQYEFHLNFDPLL